MSSSFDNSGGRPGAARSSPLEGEGESAHATAPIAVVGMGCRYPGANDTDAFWRLVRDGIDATGEIPPSRWDADQFFDPTGEVPGKMSTRWGGFVDDVDQFDALFFRISPREAEKVDPQQRLLLEVAWEALEYGGLAASSIRGAAAGVFIGIGGVDYSRIPAQSDQYFEQISVHSGTGNALSIAANRLSYAFDLRGPSVAIDTACSSSMVALHLASQSLGSGECDLALAGGVNLILTPETTVAFSNARMLSPDGVCRPFDAAANGYVRGEGCGILVLKRLQDAIAARDNVLAVIRGSAVNQDGLTSGITAPRGPAQRSVIRRALAQGGISLDHVSYIEAHGTGTPLGDPIELRALGGLFRRKSEDELPCCLGSVKANIGHTETAAGVAGLIKVILMMQHRCIPGQTHFEKLNPLIDFSGTRLRIPLETRAWDGDAPRIAGISSFGFGGTNAHVVLEEPPRQQTAESSSEPAPHLLTLSAKTPTALCKMGERYAEYLGGHPEVSLPDLCHTANTGRTHFEYRAAIAFDDGEQLRQRLADLASDQPQPHIRRGETRNGRRQNVAFLFAGQGSQYLGMGRRLFETEPVFRDTLVECERLLRDSLDQPLLTVLFEEPGGRNLLDQTAYTQPALFALEYALATLWRHWGVEPKVVLGHSVGEYVAACIADVYSLEDGLRLVAGRARLMQGLPGGGSMAVILADARRVAEAIEPFGGRLTVAAANGPENTVISGSTDSVDTLVEQLGEEGIRTKKLTVSHAFHSPLVEPILGELERLARGIPQRAPRIPLISNLTGQLLSNQAPDAAYWRHHARNCVRFADSIQCLAAREPDAVLEIGPSTTLLSMARRCWPAVQPAWLPSLCRGRNDREVTSEALSELYVRGAVVDWAARQAHRPHRRLVLPTYPFERRRHWYSFSDKPGLSHRTVSNGPAVHPLLGHRIASAGNQRLLEVRLSSNKPAYLAEHRVQGSAVVPAAAFIEQSLAAGNELFGEGNHVLESLSIQNAMVLAEDSNRIAQVVMSRESHGECQFRTYSRTSTPESEPSDEQWDLHACGTLRAGTSLSEDERPDPIALRQVLDRVAAETDRETFYQSMADCGLAYGVTFQVLSGLKQTQDEALATVEPPSQALDQAERYRWHPAILDGCFQLVAGVVPLDEEHHGRLPLYLPTFVRRVRFHDKPTQNMWAYARRTSDGNVPVPETVEADVYLLDETGRVLVELAGVRATRVGHVSLDPGRTNPAQWLYSIDWQPRASTRSGTDNESSGDSPTNWLVFADQQGLADRLVDHLRRRGDSCTVVRRGARFQTIRDNGSRIAEEYQMDPLSSGDYQRLLEQWPPSAGGPAGVVHLWNVDLNGDERLEPLAQATRMGCASCLLLASQLARAGHTRSAPLYLVTRGAQPIDDSSPVNPAQSAVWGLGRTASVEMVDLKCRLVDLDPSDSLDQGSAALVDELLEDSPETQVGFRGGSRYVARLQAVPDAVSQDRAGGAPRIPRTSPFSLRLGRPGHFESLAFAPVRRHAVQPRAVEIEVRSAGLNFSDVLKAMGLYPGITDEIVPLGIECAGVVTAVGADVDRFRVGDRVMGVAPDSLSSHAVTAEYALAPTPDQLTDDQACTIPITFLTAYYALRRLADLQPEERVLIHAGAGGVGLAAIQIAQHVGAEIFATAGSDEKREFLRSLGIQHVMNSRTLDFATQIRQLTAGRGVDVVLNSLPGEAITESISVLSSYGRFLEIGKIDIYQNRMIGLLPFQDNLSYFAVDLDRMLRQRPDYIRRLFDEVMPYFEQAVYRPLPLTLFPADRVVDAFRYMSQRKNIGKVVVDIGTVSTDRKDGAESGDEMIRGDGTYLVTGGLGARGLRVANWLSSQGAKHIALMSRRPPTAEVCQQLESLSKSGARVAVLEGDVSDTASLRSALARIPSGFPALRGVFHAAGVLADGMMFDMDVAQLDKAMAPKVQGAWNLHEATRDAPLNLFVMFSSVASVLGSPGQANYAAGNAFLDGLACYRRSRGLPATSINWGPWSDGGMADAKDRQRQLSLRGMQPLPPDDALQVMGDALRSEVSNLTVMNVRWSDLLARMQGEPPPFLEAVSAHSGEAQRTSAADDVDEAFCQKLREATDSQRELQLCEYIGGEVALVMGIDRGSLDTDQTLSSFGLDSLMGMELKGKIESRLGFDLPMASLFDNPTVRSLARIASDHFGPNNERRSNGVSAKQAVAKSGPEPGNGTWSPLVSLANGGPRPPLFCVHPIGGDLRCYLDMVRCLRDDRPVWGLRPRGLEERMEPHSSMDEMVRDYIDAIRRLEPDGSFHLAGWSTGGIYAYEIVSQLLAEGATVGTLVLLDTPTPSIFQDVDLTDDARFLVDLVDFSNWFAGTRMQVSYQQLRKNDSQRAIELVLEQARKNAVLPSDTPVAHLRRLIEVCKQNVHAIMRYVPPALSQPVHLIRPEDTTVLAEASGQTLEEDLGWGRISDGWTIHTVPGNHFSMMTGTRARHVAERLQACLVTRSDALPVD